MRNARQRSKRYSDKTSLRTPEEYRLIFLQQASTEILRDLCLNEGGIQLALDVIRQIIPYDDPEDIRMNAIAIDNPLLKLDERNKALASRLRVLDPRSELLLDDDCSTEQQSRYQPSSGETNHFVHALVLASPHSAAAEKRSSWNALQLNSLAPEPALFRTSISTSITAPDEISLMGYQTRRKLFSQNTNIDDQQVPFFLGQFSAEEDATWSQLMSPHECFQNGLLHAFLSSEDGAGPHAEAIARGILLLYREKQSRAPISDQRLSSNHYPIGLAKHRCISVPLLIDMTSNNPMTFSIVQSSLLEFRQAIIDSSGSLSHPSGRIESRWPPMAFWGLVYLRTIARPPGVSNASTGNNSVGDSTSKRMRRAYPLSYFASTASMSLRRGGEWSLYVEDSDTSAELERRIVSVGLYLPFASPAMA